MSELEPVDYTHGGKRLTGLLAKPATPAIGAVIVFPTIVNANSAMEKRARMLAELGYLAMVADFYGEPVKSFAAAGPLADALRADPVFYRARLAAGIKALRGHRAANGLSLAALGYCMGGGAALEAARDGQDLVAAVSFHGLLTTQTPAQPGDITGRILVLHGDADPMVPRSQVAAFQEEMDKAGADWHFHSYSGVRHGFTDPASDERDLEAVSYDASADRQSWAAMQCFLQETFEAAAA